jgi:hypothetical protein
MPLPAPNSMISPPVYLGTMTLPGGLPMAGYKVVVVAELMPRAEAQFVKDVRAQVVGTIRGGLKVRALRWQPDVEIR